MGGGSIVGAKGTPFANLEFSIKEEVEITLEFTCMILKTALNFIKLTNVNIYES
jgi:hypothetical protein